MNDQELSGISAVISESMKIKGISVEKLSQLTGVSDRFITLLLDEQHKKLPSAPYVRGYLARIGTALNLNGEQLWENYESQHAEAQEGKRNVTTTHAFSAPTPRPLALVIGGIIALILVVIGIRAFFFSRSSELILQHFPETVSTSTLAIRGTVDPASQLTINGEEIHPDAQGAFEKQVTLTPGFNTFRFTTKGILGREFAITKQVYFATSTKHVEQKTTTE